jgi:2-succinyl-5-enolpyruvyl-6-hydroxy-3-cyclohexene-1-carboxylate synthase
VGEFCRRVAGEVRGSVDRSWLERWTSLAARADEVIASELAGQSLSEPAVARILSEQPHRLVVASSMPVRDVEWFGAAVQRATVYSNRGANGIDGTVATAAGIAAASGEPVVVLLGDVALLHDASSLTALADRGVDVRIVVVDNDGGGIFSFLPQASSLPTARFEQLFGTPHGTDLLALAAAHLLPAATVGSAAELQAWLERPGPWLVRVPSTRDANVVDHRRLNDAVLAAMSPSAR